MINPEDEIIVDSRTSCTKDEAAAKLLGWMQGTIRKKYIKVTEHGIPANSGSNWTRIPRQTGQPFQSKLDSKIEM